MISPPHLSGSQQRPGVLLFCLSLLIAGCTSIGPPTVRRDRLDYADAMADASKRETLLNIVKLRYGDTPSMVTVNQLVAGYTLEGRVTAAEGDWVVRGEQGEKWPVPADEFARRYAKVDAP